MFREQLRCDDDRIRRLELIYFAGAVDTFVYLRFSKDPNREQTLDRFTRGLLEKSIPHAREQTSLPAVVKEYQQRYKEYGALLQPLFGKVTPDPATTLGLHLFECVTRSSAQGRMLLIVATSPVLSQFVKDHIDFVRKKI